MAHSSESSDDEAPETFSFSTSKKAAKVQDEALQKFHAEEKQKLKDKRRERDRVLKERKAQAKGRKNTVEKSEARSKGKGKETNVEAEDGSESESESEESADDEVDKKGRAELEARMAKAMKDAENEEADEHNDLEDESERPEFSQHEAGSASVDGSSSDEDDGEEPSKPLSKRPKLSKSSDYLPDHLFASALSEAATLTAASKGAKSKSKSSVATPKPKKRKRSTQGPKDVVVGTRTIRTLSAPSQSAAPPSKAALAPPPAVTKFVSRTLNLRSKERTAKAKGWERRSANVGVMKRNGPAAQFVRG